MVQICPRCQRANPREAVFCFFDGNLLRQGGPSPLHLPQEFVFPSGRRCRTFEELVQGCQYEWEDARTALRRGDFARYFAHINRHDLVRAAEEGQNQPDPDIALHQFLRHLPASVEGPRLDLNPRRLTLGAVRPGEQRQFQLTIINQGKGLLQGKVSVSEGGQWLHLDATGAANEQAIKTGRAQQITVHINARGLASPQTYVGKLTVITNGGISEVPVRLDVTSVAFLKPPFQGVSSPRELAERMRSHPRQAAPLLESGEVARWFQVNGWAYPVAGGCAKGVAAVQQFFEGMGLSKPPPLQISDSSMQFLCVAPETAHAKITLRTTARKWVYAQADTDVPWMRVTTPNVSGPQQVQIAFEIDSSLLDPGPHLGTVQILANAGQKLAVQVHVDVRWPQEPFTRRLLRPFFVGALLALMWRLVLVIPADVCGRLLGSSLLPQTLEQWLGPPGAETAFLRGFVLATSWIGVPTAVFLVTRRGGGLADLLGGLVAGVGAGLIVSASLGCVLLLFDAFPRAILTHITLAQKVAPPVVWLLLWVALACLCWALLGGGAGFLLSGLGQRGLSFLRAFAGPFVWLFRVCGLERAAAFFLLQG